MIKPRPGTRGGEPQRCLFLEEAEPLLDGLLDGLRSSPWQEVAWRFSRLTGCGFPVEREFSLGDGAVRATTEVAGPEIPNRGRLAEAGELLDRLGSTPPRIGVFDAFRRVQRAGPLRWGCWLGARRDGAGRTFKLYLEIPRAVDDPAGCLLGPIRALSASGVPRLSDRWSPIRMVAYETGTGRTEAYVRPGAMNDWLPGSVLGRLEIDDGGALTSLIEDGTGAPADLVLTGPNWGYSVAVEADGRPLAFSLFTFARRLFGGDGGIRAGLLSLAARRGWDAAAYAEATASLAGSRGRATHQGLVNFTVRSDGTVSAGIGVCCRQETP